MELVTVTETLKNFSQVKLVEPSKRRTLFLGEINEGNKWVKYIIFLDKLM
jgi:hypothetical protein